MRAPAEQVVVDVDSSFEWPFEVKTIIVDNLTDHYAYSPDAQRFIQPNIAGLVLPIHPTQTPRLLWKAPPGKSQPTLASAAQELTIVFVDSLFPPTSGSTVVAAVTSTWPDGTAALPGFANQNDLSMGLYRKAANQLGFSVAGIEQLELGNGYAAIPDGTAAAPGLSFLSDLTSGLSRLGAAVLGFSISGVERARLTATTFQVTGLNIVPSADNTGNIGTSALRFSNGIFAGAVVIGTNPATVGSLRLPNQSGVAMRNLLNTANVDLIDMNASNNVVVDFTGFGCVIGPAAGGWASIGATPATSGLLRLPNAGWISARNVGNTGDGLILRMDTGNNTVLDSINGALTSILNQGTEMIRLNSAAIGVDFRQAGRPVGGGAGATLGTIGGTGPTVAAMNQWLPCLVNGNARFIPVWA